MATKYIFVTGGVVSGLGKGITAASLGRLLKARGMKVTMQKLDPYLNVDPGTMNPIQHGEVFVTEDGAETDLDLGHYERFIDEFLSKYSSITSGKVFWTVLSRERHGDYGGGTVQIIPHITNCIKENIVANAQTTHPDIAIVEIGGTVGDIEGQPFLEAIRQFSIEQGRENCMFIHLSLVPYIPASGEFKTKPTQHSVKQLLSIGIQPDMVVVRAEQEISKELRDKIGLFCNIPGDNIITNIDVPILYDVPMALEEQQFAQKVCKRLGLACPKPNLDDWISMIDSVKHPVQTVNIGLVGKYISLHDAYLSVVEALKHGGVPFKAKVNIVWIDSETVTEETVEEAFREIDGILVPGGFGTRGTEGKILAAQYARTHKVPYLGICLGMQIAVIEFARNVLGWRDANSAELDPDTSHAVIDLLPEQKAVTDLGGTMRLGQYPCKLEPGSKAREAYNKEIVAERHRHRFEVNNDYREAFEEAGMVLCGKSPDGRIVEMIELPDHPWFVACQFHPEFKSRPNNPHPLFQAFIKAGITYKK